MTKFSTTMGVLAGGVSLVCLGMALERARNGAEARSPTEGGGVTRLGAETEAPASEQLADGPVNRDADDAGVQGGKTAWPFPTEGNAAPH